MRLKNFIAILFLFTLGYSIFWIIKFARYQPKLRIGVNAFSGAEHFHIAFEESFFERSGMRVKLVEFGSIEDAQQAFEWHQIDAMICPFVDALVMQQKPHICTSKIILIPSYSNKHRACHLMVQPHIKSIQELKGKKIGTEINSFGCYVLCQALKTAGLTLKDINVVPMDPTAALTFMRHERVDGIIVYPPFIEYLRDTNFHSVYSTATWPKEMLLNVFLINQTTLRMFKKPLIQFIKQWDRILDLCKTKPDHCEYLLSFHHSISNEESNYLLKSVSFLTIEEQIPLFCLNRYLLDIISNINTEILGKNNLPLLDANNAWESIFDISLLKKTIKQ